MTGTTTSLISSANPSVPGQSVTFTATVTGNTPTGTVQFQDGAIPLAGCIAVALTANQAQCTSSSLSLDIDDNGSVDALTDGLLIIRYLFGLSGNALIGGAIDLPLANRTTAGEIETYLQSLLP